MINMTRKIKRTKDLNLIKEYIESQNEVEIDEDYYKIAKERIEKTSLEG